MQLFLDVSKVTSGVFPPCNSADVQNAGLWHNFFMYITLKRLQDFGTNDPDLATWSKYMEDTTDDLESKKLLPDGSPKIVSDIIKVLNDAQGTSSFAPTIKKLQDIHQLAISNPNFKDTPILAITSVAYYSALFLSQVKDHSTDQPLGIPKWLTGVAADIGGALGGIGTGILLGPWGAVGGGILGAAAGTIAAL